MGNGGPGNIIDHRQRVFVHVVESPNATDLFDGRTEGNMLCQALRLAEINTWYRLTTSVGLFRRALSDELALASSQFGNSVPIIHISAHGNQEGIGFTNGDFLRWADFREVLVPINRALNGHLILCLSCCEGGSGIRMAMESEKPLPFHALIGHYGSPTWSDSAVAFVSLYHLLFKGAGIDQAIAAMRLASGDSGFVVEYGATVLQNWNAYIEKQNQTQHRGALAYALAHNAPSRQ